MLIITDTQGKMGTPGAQFYYDLAWGSTGIGRGYLGVIPLGMEKSDLNMFSIDISSGEYQVEIDFSALPLDELLKLEKNLHVSHFLDTRESIENFLQQNGASGANLFFDFNNFSPYILQSGKRIYYDKKKYHIAPPYEKIKQALGEVIEGMFNASQKDTQEKYQKQIEILRQNLEPNPGEIYIFTFYKLENVLECVFPEEIVKIAKNWNFYESHLEKLIIKFEGSGCNADKSRWLLNRHIDFKKTGQEPDMQKKEGEYWKPGFGTWQQWSKLINEIENLLYGNFKVYLIAWKELWEAGEKYAGERRGN